jgi:hypothetical protein
MKIYNKYIKEPYSPDDLLTHTRFSKLILKNVSLSIKAFIGALIFCFIIPFIPSHRTGYTPAPTSVNEYLNKLGEIWISLLILYLFLNFIATSVTYIRCKIDVFLNYKKTGNFLVRHVLKKGSVKIVILKGTGSLKVLYSNPLFNEIATGQTLEIQRTATNKLKGYKILPVNC